MNNFYKDTDCKLILNCIKSQYSEQMMLGRGQTTKLLGIGVSTLDLCISQGRDNPRYIKMSGAKNFSYSLFDNRK